MKWTEKTMVGTLESTQSIQYAQSNISNAFLIELYEHGKWLTHFA